MDRLAATVCAVCAAVMVVIPDAALSQESEGALTSAGHPVSEVIWPSGKSGQSHVPAVRIGDENRFVCLRPPDSPRAKPETLIVQEQEFPIELLASDFKTGLCLLQITGDPMIDDAKMPAIQLAAAGSWPAPGSSVLAFDFETGLPTKGKIAGRDLIYQSQEQPVTLLRVYLAPEAEISRALPLFDNSRTTLIGFLIPESLENRGEFHAVPAVFAAKLIRDYETFQMPALGKLGASFDVGSTTPQVVAVREDSAAHRAGLKKGDVILRIGDWKISRLSDVIEVLRTLTPEYSVEVEVLRGLQTVTVEVVPETVKSGAKP